MYQKRKIRAEKKNNDSQKSFSKVTISWYPGHMAKTKNEVKKIMPLIDVVFELIDARIPYSSKMRDIDDIIKNKFRVLVMTKKDLCDISVTNKWINYYENLGYKVVLTNLSSGDDYKDVLNATSEVINKINDIRKEKGLKPKEIKALVMGVPNVGKSTFINKLAHKKVASTGNKPGVTKSNTWLKTKYNMVILDTPGVLWPKMDDKLVAYNLAATGAIRLEVLPINDVAYHILECLNKYYPNKLKERYGLDKLTDDTLSDYDIIKNKLNIKGEASFNIISKTIIDDVRMEYIKGITLDRNDN